METKESNKVAVTYRLPPAVAERVGPEACRRGMSQGGLVEEALREKYERTDTGRDSTTGLMAGLSNADMARVRKFVACLRADTTNRGFRRAVDANFAWLLESVTTK
jgi:hypothetical protein